MKKLLLLSALLIFACSSDDSNSNDTDCYAGFQFTQIKPPCWIMGVWHNDNPDLDFTSGFAFIPNNFGIISNDDTFWFVERAVNNGVIESLSDSFYYIQIMVSTGGMYEYDRFEKISATQISLPNQDGTIRTFTKQP